MSQLPIATLLDDRRGKPTVATIAATTSLLIGFAGGEAGANEVLVTSSTLLIGGGATNRDVNLPTAGPALIGVDLVIVNSGATNDLVLKDAVEATTIATVQEATSARVRCIYDGSVWTWVAV